MPKTRPGTMRAVQQLAEREAIIAALGESGYNKARAAALLGIHRTLLYKKMKKYEIPLQAQ
jgi:DNA-binding NtrC family response regulator